MLRCIRKDEPFCELAKDVGVNGLECLMANLLSLGMRSIEGGLFSVMSCEDGSVKDLEGNRDRSVESRVLLAGRWRDS